MLKLFVSLLLASGLGYSQAQSRADHWIATWGAAQQLMSGGSLPGGARPHASVPAPPAGVPQRQFAIPPRIDGFNNQTIRMIVRTSAGGSAVRVRLSSALGSRTVQVGSVHVALHAKDSAIVPESDRMATFGGKPSTTLYSGQVVISDPIALNLPPLSELAVSVFLPGETSTPTQHLFGLHTTYIASGDATGRVSLPDASTSESYYWLAGVDVLAPADAGTLVAFGDSITDGDQSTPNTNGMWPALLAERLRANPATAGIGVVNAGIAGNRLLGNDSSGVVRLLHDGLDQPGVKWLMLLEGINDITAATRDAAPGGTTAEDIIAGYGQVIQAAHLRGVRVIGCTLTPYGGSSVWRAAGEEIRLTVNRWVRTSGAFDAMVDFDAATRDEKDPQRFRSQVDSPDLLHPANAGYKLMADAIDLSVFTPGWVPAGARRAEAPLDPALPSVFIAGDSTAAEGNPDAVGWGRVLAGLFDPARVNLVNRARGGRSSRTFVEEGLWAQLLGDVKAGDYVLIQFGHNDGGPINGEKIARGSLPGLGEESQEIDNLVTKRHETVQTYGWYMRKMIRETKARGAMPILLSLTVRNIWKDGHVERGSGKFGQWTRELAQSETVPFIDLTNLVADQYEKLGSEAVARLFPKDHTHTSEAGAALNARFVVSGLKALRENAVIRTLNSTGRAIPTAPPSGILAAKLPSGRGNSALFNHWLNLPLPADPSLPSVFLIGDSTVRNGRGDGSNDQWGWGDPLAAYLDPARVNLVNRAVGGTGSLSFLSIGYWDRVMAMLRKGDIVIMQFGHNDNGPLGPLHGVGEETEQRQNPGASEAEAVHSYGWYLRKYIAGARSRGAVPIVCTLVPRNIWENGKIARPRDSHADWARQVAEQEKVPLLDLYERIARRYDEMGESRVTELFADKRVHTTRAGAEINAEIVISAARELSDDPLAPYLRTTPADVW